jgi:hypothetical protein
MAIWNSSVSTGSTSWPSAWTTVIGRPGIRKLKLVMAEAHVFFHFDAARTLGARCHTNVGGRTTGQQHDRH